MIQASWMVHRRLILEIGQGIGDDAAMRVAVAIARGLGLNLHGVFVEDESLLQLAALPFAREIRLPSHRWQPMDSARLQAELQVAAERARRRLSQAVRPTGGLGGVEIEFEVLRGQPHLCIGGVCTPADIVLLSANVGDSPSGVALLRSAEEAGIAVLLAPSRLARDSGPGVVVAAGADDADLALAAQIAAMNNERATIVLPEAALLADLGVAAERLNVRVAVGPRPDEVLRALADARERIVVVTKSVRRQWGLDAAARFAGMRGSPVLAL